MSRSKVLVPLVAISLVLSSCSSKPPQAEVEAANLAYAEAQTARADILSPESFALARSANDALQASLNAREYGKAKALAKALSETSATATTDAAVSLASVKADALRLGQDIAAEIPLLQKLYARAAAKKAKLDLKTMKAGLADANASLAEASAKLAIDVVAAKAQLDALKGTLDGYMASLEAAGFKE
jgi:hypothetical protein